MNGIMQNGRMGMVGHWAAICLSALALAGCSGASVLSLKRFNGVSLGTYGVLLRDYAQAHAGVFPWVLQDLQNCGYDTGVAKEPYRFLDVDTGRYYDWMYFGSFCNLHDPPDTIIVASPSSFIVSNSRKGNKERIVLLLDGSVKTMEEADFYRSLRRQLEATMSRLKGVLPN